ncbi:ABC transporter permease [Streptomyces bohaiensis]|uniref:ABC transporter permease n=1 Tax=Streptomyces bohaiensis TaxID=1431344 RepID=UPI001ADDAF7A|nr:ABC transporter permease [Streptomyces bohaiensis]
MSATSTTSGGDVPAPGPPAVRRDGRTGLVGTGALVRFALRRDRVRLPAWLLALTLSTYAMAVALVDSFPDEAAREAVRASSTSPATLALNGPAHYLDDYHYGAMLGHQAIGFVGLFVALLCVLTVVRHTRAEEETGRAELLRATAVGRHAHLTAAVLVAAGAALGVGILTGLALSSLDATGYTPAGALAFGAAYAGLGLVFTGVAAVTTQISAHARAASGTALAVLGAAYALRAAGDSTAGGSTDWLSWLSPVGWAQRTYPYLDNDVGPLLLCLGTAGVLTAGGFVLSLRRDVGAGLRASRPGRREATAWLTRPVGFALRLHRGLLYGFTAAVVVLGAMYGSVLGDVESMLQDIDVMQDALGDLGGGVVESFAALVMVPQATIVGVYAVLATLRARAEESSGRAEHLLATALSRRSWLGSHIAVALVGSTVVSTVGGLTFGTVGAVATGDGSLVLDMALAGLAYAPALWVTVGVAVMLVGWAPRAAGLAWAVPVGAFLLGYLGALMRFPTWVLRLDPFGHVPRLPAEAMQWTPLLVLTALAAVLVRVGLAGFRRRDLDTR